jgi:hypothetical protein
MCELCVELRTYLRYGHHEAIVTTVDSSGSVNSAPMGIELRGDSILLRPYVGSKTYSNLVSTKEATINITNDSKLYYYSLFTPQILKYSPSKLVRPPRILGDVDLYIECEVINIDNSVNPPLIYLRSLCCDLGSGCKLAFSRANSLVIEALVHYTKLPVLIREGNVDGVKRRVDVITYAYEVVERVGDEELKLIIKDILGKALTLIKDLES